MPWNFVARTCKVRFCEVHPNRPIHQHTVGCDFPLVRVSLLVNFLCISRLRDEVSDSTLLPISRISDGRARDKTNTRI